MELELATLDARKVAVAETALVELAIGKILARKLNTMKLGLTKIKVLQVLWPFTSGDRSICERSTALKGVKV